MIDLKTATELVNAHLDNMQFEGGLEIVGVEEYLCGWAFYYNSAEYVRTKDDSHALGGNIPILVVRSDGAMYLLGSIRNRYDPNRYPEGCEELLRLND